jgi:hypothetical protein
MTETKPSNIITAKSSQDLMLTTTQVNDICDQLIDSKQISEIFSKGNPYKISLRQFYDQLRKPENSEIKIKIEESRKLGIQTLLESLIRIYSNTDSVPDPNMVMWLKEKSRFCQFLAEKIIPELYGVKSKEMINKGTVNNIVVSWLDSEELQQKYNQYEEINQAKTKIIDQ